MIMELRPPPPKTNAITTRLLRLLDTVKGGVYIPQQGPDHQISLTQITNHQKKKNSLIHVITKILMHYESVDGSFHAAHTCTLVM